MEQQQILTSLETMTPIIISFIALCVAVLSFLFQNVYRSEQLILSIERQRLKDNHISMSVVFMNSGNTYSLIRDAYIIHGEEHANKFYKLREGLINPIVLQPREMKVITINDTVSEEELTEVDKMYYGVEVIAVNSRGEIYRRTISLKEPANIRGGQIISIANLQGIHEVYKRWGLRL